MYYSLASKLYLNEAGPATAYSEAVALTPKGNVEVQATAIVLNGGTIQVHLEVSNDRENWREPYPATYVNLTAVGYAAVKITDLTWRWVRLKYLIQTAGNGAEGIVAAGIRVEDLTATPQPWKTPPAAGVLPWETGVGPKRSGGAGPPQVAM